MSVFDPNTFMNSTLDTANSTVNEPIPVGEYIAIIDKADVRSIESKKGGENSVIMDITWDIQDAQLKETLGRDKISCRQSVFLDVTSQGTLDMGKGKNVGLGKVRAALNQNIPGQPWSPGMLSGAGPALVRIAHRTDRNDSDVIYSEVKAVTAA